MPAGSTTKTTKLASNTMLPATIDSVAAMVSGDDVLHVIFVLDRSGSMSGKEADVIGGFNSYVDTLRTSPDGQVGISYVRFDDTIELIWNDLPLAGVPEMSADTYSVRGNTALLDAVGATVSAIHDDPAHRYTVIIHTDGMENASREWTAEKVKALVADREARGNWTFAFFGEGLDAWSQAAAYGFADGRSVPYDRDDMKAIYIAKGRVENVMRNRKMAKSAAYATAADAVRRRRDIDDDEIARILTSDGGNPGKEGN